MVSVTDEINQFVLENGGNERDALNVALARLKAQNVELMRLRKLQANIDMGDVTLEHVPEGE